MSDILRFAWIVATNIQALITGGVVAAGLSIYEHRRGEQVSWKTLKRVIAVFVLISSYQAWHDLDMIQKGHGGATSLRSEVVTIIGDISQFQHERTAVENASEQTLAAGMETVRLFREHFRSRLVKLAEEIPPSLISQSDRIRQAAESPMGSDGGFLVPLLEQLRSVSASL